MPRMGRPFGWRHGLRWQYCHTADGDPDTRFPDAGETSMEVDVGCCLRRLREEQNLTIRALAEKSGLSPNTLSLIENGRSSPSVSTLQQLAWALAVPVTAFFEARESGKQIAYIKKNLRPRAVFDQGTLEDLGAGTSIQAVEPFVVTLEPNAGSGPQDIVHTGYEFVYCLEGRMAYRIDGHPYLLEPGDSLLFEAHLPHCWQNIHNTRSRCVLVLYPFDERDSPTERHFAGEQIQE